VKKYRNEDPEACLDVVRRRLAEPPGTIQVKTPDRTLDLLVNGWLLYQTLACRIWARAAFYQAGVRTAFGISCRTRWLSSWRGPLSRAPICYAPRPDNSWRAMCSTGGIPRRVEGFEPISPTNRVWLPFVLLRYLEVTGDASILREEVPFLEGGPRSTAEQEDAYFTPSNAPRARHALPSTARAPSTGPSRSSRRAWVPIDGDRRLGPD